MLPEVAAVLVTPLPDRVSVEVRCSDQERCVSLQTLPLDGVRQAFMPSWCEDPGGGCTERGDPSALVVDETFAVPPFELCAVELLQWIGIRIVQRT